MPRPGMAEPSRSTAGRRRREMFAESRELDAKFGPDESRIVRELDLGWSVRRVERIEDQWREGKLARNCLKTVKRPDPNVWSLRDPENLPRLTFAVYLV